MKVEKKNYRSWRDLCWLRDPSAMLILELALLYLHGVTEGIIAFMKSKCIIDEYRIATYTEGIQNCYLLCKCSTSPTCVIMCICYICNGESSIALQHIHA